MSAKTCIHLIVTSGVPHERQGLPWVPKQNCHMQGNVVEKLTCSPLLHSTRMCEGSLVTSV